MLKRIFFYLFIAATICLSFFYVHTFLLAELEQLLRYELLAVYLFHAIASFGVYLIIEITANKSSIQIAYAFLPTLFLKLMFFVIFFKPTIFTLEKLTMTEKTSLLLPLFLFLFLEVIALLMLLNKQEVKN